MKIIRTIIERLSRGKVIKRKIYVKGNTIPLLVSPDAQLKYVKFWKNAFNSDLINIAERFLNEESNVWDIGANVEVFTFPAAAVAHKGTIKEQFWLLNQIFGLRRFCVNRRNYLKNELSPEQSSEVSRQLRFASLVIRNCYF